MKKLLPVLLLSSLALTACVVPYDYYDSGRQDGRDRYDQRYERYDDRYDQRYDGKRYDDQNDQRYDRYDDSRYRRDGKYYDDDYIEYQIYNDPSFEQKRAQVMRILERRGYQVHEIEADDRRRKDKLPAAFLFQTAFPMRGRLKTYFSSFWQCGLLPLAAYKQHTRTDEEGYIEKLHITPANTHECNHLSPLLEGIADGTTVYADKGYDSAENRQHLKEHQLLDGIMRKAHRNRPLTEAQTKRNRYLSKTRYVVEQSFGTLHRKFRYARAAYFGLIKVSAQSHLKAMCLNLLKAANRLNVSVAA